MHYWFYLQRHTPVRVDSLKIMNLTVISQCMKSLVETPDQDVSTLASVGEALGYNGLGFQDLERLGCRTKL